MLRPLLAFALALTCAGSTFAEPPAFVVQSKPVSALIAEWKSLAKLAGGDAAAADFEDWLDATFGEDGLKGLDLTKPVVAYAPLKGKADGAKVFVILPIRKEQDFLDLLERLDREATPMPKDQTLYRVGEDDDLEVYYFRIHKGHAHFVLNGAAKDLDVSNLVDPIHLIDAGETALLSAIFRPGTADATFRKSALEQLETAASFFAGFPFLPGDFGLKLTELAQSSIPLAKAALEDAKTITLKLDREPGAKDVSVEIAVVPKPGTPMAKAIAARQPTANRFGGLVDWPDAAAVLLVQQPSWNADARKAFAGALQSMVKGIGPGLSQEFESSLTTLIDGLLAPAKAGTLEFGAALTAPDKSGFGGVAFAISHDDPAGLLKALQELMKKPPEEFGESRDAFGKAVKLNAAKVGELAIHTVDMKIFLSETAQAIYGEKCLLAVAFDKRELYVAFGTGAVELVKRLPVVKPRDVGAVDLRVNPKKLADWPKAGREELREAVERSLGQSDKLESVGQLSITGTGDLKIRAKLAPATIRFFRELDAILGGNSAPVPAR